MTGKAEVLRQLRAAAEGRYRKNAAGRYVIDGETKPDPRARVGLWRDQRISLPYHEGEVELTEGRVELARLEGKAMNG